MSKLTTVISGIWIILALFITISFVNVPPPPYEHQIDARKREYYPAIVVDKKYYQSCSKSSCSNNHIIVIEREDKTYDDVYVTENVYMTHNVGDTINFERHISDPKVYNHWDNNTPPFFGQLLMIFVPFTIGLIVWMMLRDL